MLSQVLVRNVPADPDESISESVEHFFLVNHPDHYLTHQVVYNANDLAALVEQKKSTQNWLDYYQLKYTRNQEHKPRIKVIEWSTGLRHKLKEAFLVPYLFYVVFFGKLDGFSRAMGTES